LTKIGIVYILPLEVIGENKHINLVMSNLNKLDPKWIQWFIGLADGEGNFQTFPKKRLKNSNITHYNIGYGFHLGMSLRDLALIKTIHSKLNNLGRIYEYADNKNEAHLAITKLNELKWVILNIFDYFPLLTNHQWERFSRLRYGVLNSINRRPGSVLPLA